MKKPDEKECALCKGKSVKMFPCRKALGDLGVEGSHAHTKCLHEARAAHLKREEDRAELDRAAALSWKADRKAVLAVAVPEFRKLIAEFDARLREGDLKAAMKVADRADDFAEGLQGGRLGMCTNEGSATLLEKATAAPKGTEPKWGQIGSWVEAVRYQCRRERGFVLIRFEYDGFFGCGSPFSFSINAVNWFKPFPSETGYRSFCGLSPDRIKPGLSPGQWMAEAVRENIAKERPDGLPWIGAESRARHANDPVVDVAKFGGAEEESGSLVGLQLSLFATEEPKRRRA